MDTIANSLPAFEKELLLKEKHDLKNHFEHGSLLSWCVEGGRGLTVHRNPGNPQSGHGDTRVIAVHKDLLAKKYKALDEKYGHFLSQAELIQLNCDMAIYALIHENKHSLCDTGPLPKNISFLYEVAPYTAELFFSDLAKQSGLYVGGLLTAICVEVSLLYAVVENLGA